jgi:hypothetical protein
VEGQVFTGKRSTRISVLQASCSASVIGRKQPKDVPAGVREQCGEKYLDSDVYKELERLARSRDHFTEKMTVDILANGKKAAA